MVPVVLIVLFALIAVALYLVYDHRYRGRRDANARPTGERFRDPGSGEIMRVYEDPETGRREYREEK